jgi:hypothetical protein
MNSEGNNRYTELEKRLRAIENILSKIQIDFEKKVNSDLTWMNYQRQKPRNRSEYGYISKESL